ncbi:hypothetical protein DWW36_12255 [Erysipelotrichaceae bacterium AF15-26LB]|nr:hypothetical protein [[Clostridium] innocuum]RJV87104.1 hypothetical protein DWW36_12255 [Erysipelotrichaceae bacterium AF15-26LB]
MKVNVLGTQYTVIFDTLAENNRYKRCDGYCDFYVKEIHVRKHMNDDADCDEMTIPEGSMKIYEKKCLRHELIHAFLFESGLDSNTSDIDGWARNEEMIDWMAIQMPKIMAAYNGIIKQQRLKYADADTMALGAEPVLMSAT